MNRWFLLVGISLSLACGQTQKSEQSSSIPTSGNPLVGADPVTPFPSAYHLQEDKTRVTGVSVNLQTEDLPVSEEDVLTDPASFPQADGFSPATPILIYLPEGVDPASLPSITDPQASLEATSPTVIVDMTLGERIAHFAELDLNADPEKGDRQALILRPVVRLPATSRVAVALTTALTTPDGTPLAQPAGMAAILSAQPSDDARIERLRQRSPDILGALAQAGVAASDVLLAWDFVTASNDFIFSPVLHMRDDALSLIGKDASGVTFTIDDTEEDFGSDGLTLRRVRGHFETPLFLSADGGPEGKMVFGEDGLPQSQGTYAQPFTAIVPARAATDGPLPLMIMGHGLLDTGESVVSEDLTRELAETYGYVVIGTDWTGLSEDDVSTIAVALTNFNEFARITDKLQQAIVNVIVLTRVARDQLSQDEAFRVEEQSVIDATRVFYYGNSLGGIMGAAMLGRAVDIDRGVLGVPGANWGLMTQRSSHWPEQEAIFSQTYPDPLDQLILLALGQSHFDFTDPIHVAPYMLEDPLPDSLAQKILIQAGVGDAQVANIATDVLARSMGLVSLSPAVGPVFGMNEQEGPVDSALVYFDYGIEPPNLTNASPKEDNIVHEAVRQEPASQRQLGLFLQTDGQIVHTCDGPCDCTTDACE